MLLERKIKISDFGKKDIPDEIKSVKDEHKEEFDKFATEIDGGYVYVYGVTVFEKLHGIPANLKYYRTDFILRDEEYLSDALLEHIAEMVQLEHGVRIDGQHYIMVMSDEEADALEQSWSNYADVQAMYISKNVLFTSSQVSLFKDTAQFIIPDYYFNFELREEGETW